jgi:hypothetical protein
MMAERKGVIILKNMRGSEGRFVSMDVLLEKDVLYPWTFCICGRFVGWTFCREGRFVSMDAVLWSRNFWLEPEPEYRSFGSQLRLWVS